MDGACQPHHGHCVASPQRAQQGGEETFAGTTGKDEVVPKPAVPRDVDRPAQTVEKANFVLANTSFEPFFF
jgi:hypothetical protein